VKIISPLFFPNQINIIPQQAVFTIDLRNSDNEKLSYAEKCLNDFIDKTSEDEGVLIEQKQLVRFDPVEFNADIISHIQETTEQLGLTFQKITSGAGHDAQMMSRICPTAMIFVPSKKGISHNPNEFTKPEDLEAGANVLLNTILNILNS